MAGWRCRAYGDGVLGSLFAPWRRSSTWWGLGYSALSLPIGVVSFTLAVAAAATSIGLLITFPLAIPFVWLLFVVGRGVGRVERSRLDVLLGVSLPDPVRPLGPGSWWAPGRPASATGPAGRSSPTRCCCCRSGC